MQQMPQMENSIYLPYVGCLNFDRLSEIFWTGGLGLIRRVDFIDTEKGKAAFVHMNYWNINNILVQQIWYNINGLGSCKYLINTNNRSNDNPNDYIIMRKMVTPEIPESTMNIHQVAVVLTEHSKKIAELEAIILKQNDIIIQLQVQQVQQVQYKNPKIMTSNNMWEDMIKSLSETYQEDYEDDECLLLTEIMDEDEKETTPDQQLRKSMSADVCGNN